MQKYLLFQLYGVLASWGDQAVGGERPGSTHPSRSALLGLLAAAMGIRRDEEQKLEALSRQCGFAIKSYSNGQVLRDFHTAQVPPTIKKNKHLYTRRDELRESKLGTTLSFREYRQDALAVIALRLNDTAGTGLSELCQALASPAFHLYLGRKSCPLSLPLNPQILSAQTVKSALDEYKIDTSIKMLQQDASYYWEKTDNMGCTADFQTIRYDQPLSRKRWQFLSRPEYVCLNKEG
ncbi:MAG TPA: type I-E CRISPR-associated protein Cas5/CasD [Aeromonadales bacterium]|nr:type I-E CRISPR-associated protein Cas5/CasD [Aeromonadales bacterium]